MVRRLCTLLPQTQSLQTLVLNDVWKAGVMFRVTRLPVSIPIGAVLFPSISTQMCGTEILNNHCGRCLEIAYCMQCCNLNETTLVVGSCMIQELRITLAMVSLISLLSHCCQLSVLASLRRVWSLVRADAVFSNQVNSSRLC